MPPLCDVHRRDERAALDDQLAAVPLDALDADERVQLTPVRPVQAGRDVQLAVPAQRQVGPEPAPLPDHRHRPDRLLGNPPDQLQQLSGPARSDQVVSQPVHRRQLPHDPAVHLGQVLLGQPHELRPEAVGRPAQFPDVQPDVVDQRLVLMLADQPGQAAPQERVDGQQRADAIGVVADVRAGLRDRQRAGGPLAPVVDRLGDHLHGPGQHVGQGHDLNVLPDHALGVGQPVLGPERPAEQLVPHRDVVERQASG